MVYIEKKSRGEKKKKRKGDEHPVSAETKEGRFGGGGVF